MRSSRVFGRVTATTVRAPNLPSAPGKSLCHQPPTPSQPRATTDHARSPHAGFDFPGGSHTENRTERPGCVPQHGGGTRPGGRSVVCVKSSFLFTARAVCSRGHLCSDFWAVLVWGCLRMLECEAVCEGVCSLTPGERGGHTAGSRGRGAPALTPPDRFRGGCPVSRSCRGGGRQPRHALAVLTGTWPCPPFSPRRREGRSGDSPRFKLAFP